MRAGQRHSFPVWTCPCGRKVYQYLAISTPPTSNSIEEGLRVLTREITELERLRDRIGDDFANAVAQLHAAVSRRAKIVLVGVGKSGNIAHKLCATLNSTGATSVVLGAQNALHGDLGLIDQGDVAIAYSYSGETDEVLQILPHLKRAGLPVIAITGGNQSALARASDIVLDVSVEREACPLDLSPTASTTCMLALSDALAMALLVARGFQKEEFANLHPGGTLGRSLLTRVCDIMRPLDKVAQARPGDTVSDALGAMSTSRGGATLVLSEDGSLEGIFTHGDFARAYQIDPAVGSQKVADVMTAAPVSVEDDRLAAEALRLLEEHRIDDLPVVDSSGKAVGLVDSQDLGRLRMV